MVNFEKITKKLAKFDELSTKKTTKLFRAIFEDDDFRNWYYGVDVHQSTQRDMQQFSTMLSRIFGTKGLAKPSTMIKLTEYVAASNLDHTGCALVYTVIDNANTIVNDAAEHLSAELDNGLDRKTAAKKLEKCDKYREVIRNLLNEICKCVKTKKMAESFNMSNTLIQSTYFIVPDRKYIQTYRINKFMSMLLKETYLCVSEFGHDDVKYIDWKGYFSKLFGEDAIPSCAISILMENPRRIDAYRGSTCFDDVKRVWDSLSKFAMTALNNADDGVRRQMIEIYLKRLEKMRGGNIKTRVDLLELPEQFGNLISTLSNYRNRLSKIMCAESSNRDYSTNSRSISRGEDMLQCIDSVRSANDLDDEDESDEDE